MDDLNDAIVGDLELVDRKSVYVLLYREGGEMKAKLTRVCDSFSRERFEIPEKAAEKIIEVAKMAEETKKLVQITKKERKKVLGETVQNISGSGISLLLFQKWYLQKEKLLYTTLNMFKSENMLLTGLCWCPSKKIEGVKQTFASQQAKGIVAKFTKVDNHTLKPPTYIRTNEFTMPFQEIVNTYGTPSYGEVNPAFFTIITFPFLFGIMFGDILHGSILVGFSIFLCLGKDMIQKSKSIFVHLLRARYLFLLMGIFAVFCGVMYNDFAGLGLMFFKSCYKTHLNDEDEFTVIRDTKCMYPIGNDHYWKFSTKELSFINSYQMKVSVIIAVLQMSLGIFLKLVNSLHFNNMIDVFFEFLPQIIFLLALFGYMDVLIIGKWLTDYSSDTSKSPSIITCLTDMFLGATKEKLDPVVFKEQQTINLILLAIIIICIPWMLLPKPFLLRRQSMQPKPLKIASSSVLYKYNQIILLGKTHRSF